MNIRTVLLQVNHFNKNLEENYANLTSDQNAKFYERTFEILGKQWHLWLFGDYVTHQSETVLKHFCLSISNTTPRVQNRVLNKINIIFCGLKSELCYQDRILNSTWTCLDVNIDIFGVHCGGFTLCWNTSTQENMLCFVIIAWSSMCRVSVCSAKIKASLIKMYTVNRIKCTNGMYNMNVNY